MERSEVYDRLPKPDFPTLADGEIDRVISGLSVREQRVYGNNLALGMSRRQALFITKSCWLWDRYLDILGVCDRRRRGSL